MRILILLMGLFVSGCAILAPEEDKLAREHAKLNDKFCEKYEEFNADLVKNGLPTVSLEGYLEKVNSAAKRSVSSLNCL
jgi:hypothetical protein